MDESFEKTITDSLRIYMILSFRLATMTDEELEIRTNPSQGYLGNVPSKSKWSRNHFLRIPNRF